MHRWDVIQQALNLHARGFSAVAIADRLGVPRRTVADWVRGRRPRRGSALGNRCGACGQAPHDIAGLPDAYVYLLGMYLGDGCISRHPRDVFRLRIVLDARYPGIIEETRHAMSAVMPKNPVGLLTRTHVNAEGEEYPSCVEVSSYSKAWPCLFPQHGTGKKHERPIVLADWQHALVSRHPKPLLRGLIHSDGCRAINTGSGGWVNPRYLFTNTSEDIRLIFVSACESLGLRTTFAPKTVYVSRKADVARMDEFIGPKA
jgi:hypothetical protein